MRSLRYVLLDVFTSRRLEGNPLAVFPDGEVTGAGEMQAIARELNLAETVFVLPPAGTRNAARLRIFTPRRELTFAGHPTIGTAALLAAEGRIAAERFTFEEGVGPVPVRAERCGDETRFWLTTPPVRFGEHVDAGACAAALGLEPAGMLGVRPQYASAGSAFLFAALRDPRTVDRAVFSPHLLPQPAWSDVVGIFIFAPVPGGVYARMFAPKAGIAEDPATGGATGPLAAYLLRCGLLPADSRGFVSEQGVAMGRRSVLHVALGERDGETLIEVGGSAVITGRGRMTLSA